jgi:hypothetical protein
LLPERTRIVALVAKQRLPAVYAYRENVVAGGLMSYGADLAAQFRRTAAYVERTLEARRSPHRATDEVRADDQHEDREGARPGRSRNRCWVGRTRS